jgi:hypothetical protein
MAWYDIKPHEDSPQWRAHQEEARPNNEELKRLIETLRAASGLPPIVRRSLLKPSVVHILELRAKFEARRRRSRRSLEEVRHQWKPRGGIGAP